MGFFSWHTQDTQRSIANHFSSLPVFPVTMSDNKGNKWTETNYEGYGKFGGKDFYELLAEMNNLTTRSEGISLAFSGQPYCSPNLNESPNIEWVNEIPANCVDQGYFYDDEDEDEENDNSYWEDEEDNE